MGLKNSEIVFDNKWNTYYAGQTVNGTVNLVFDSPKTVRGIKIQFKGEANVRWRETETFERERTDIDGSKEERYQDLEAHEQYFSVEYYLLGGKTADGSTELNAGQHSYPFTCALPPTLPSSFEGEFGHIRYTVKVTLDRPWKFDQTIKTAFTVVSAVDLNLNSRVKEPIRKEIQKNFCCFCCKSGPLSIVVSLPCTGFVSGQTVPITLECDNASNVNVDAFEFILRKTVSFHSEMPRQTKKIETIISKCTAGPLESHNSENIQRDIMIPPLPPSNLTNCSIIDLDYDIKIHAKTSGFYSGVDIEIPIVLGTIPLTQSNRAGGDNNIGWNTAISNGDDSAILAPPHQSLYPDMLFKMSLYNHLSGSEKRKRKADRDKMAKQMKRSLDTFLTGEQSSSFSQILKTEIPETSFVSETILQKDEQEKPSNSDCEGEEKIKILNHLKVMRRLRIS